MAGRATLAFLGQDDMALSGDPEVTYFLEKYSTRSLSASKFNKVQFTEAVYFGQESTLVLPKWGDLITAMNLNVRLPAREVLDSAGTLMIHHVDLICDDKVVETLWGEYIEIKHDITIPQGKQAALRTMTGKVGSRTVSPARYTVPLDFTCLRHGLPLCALSGSVLSFRVSFRDSLAFTEPAIAILDPVDVNLDVEYTFLTEAERALLTEKPQTYLFERVQLVEHGVYAGQINVRIYPGLTNPVKELFMVMQPANGRGYDYMDQLVDMSMLMNGADRIPKLVGSALFLRVIQPMEYHTRTPDRKFYMYSFCLDPEDTKPTGSVNMSRIQSQVIDLTLAPSTNEGTIRLFSVHWNFFRVADGIGRVLFPNA
jgi:hypothetical protein